MANGEKKIHRVTVNSAQPIVVPRRGKLVMRKSRLLRRRFRQSFYTIGFLMSFAALGHASYGFLMGTPYLKIKTPQIEGVSPELALELSGLVEKMTRESRNILEIDEKKLTEQLSRHPKIRDLKIEKIYPDQLVINAVEREATAIAHTELDFFLLDDDGHVMGKQDTKTVASINLPYISGLNKETIHEGEQVPSASLTKALNLLQILKDRNPALFQEISEVEIQSDGVSPLETLVAHMKDGLDIRFGDGNPIDKLPQLETLLKRLNSDGIKPFTDLVYIDLSFKDMAFYMDKETALDVARNQYEELQEKLEIETEKYDKANPVKSSFDLGTDERKKSDNSKSAPRSAPAPKTAPRRSTNPSGNTNYQQLPQQYYPQQYNQQRPQYQTAPNVPYYNLPANQQRY